MLRSPAGVHNAMCSVVLSRRIVLSASGVCWEARYEPTLGIYHLPKLIDPEKFIPAANLSEIWATEAQQQAFASYFAEHYGWDGSWETVKSF